MKKKRDGFDEARLTHAGREPHDHLRVAIPARQHEEDRHEERHDQHDREIADDGEPDQHHDVARIDLARCREADDADHHRRQHDREQHHEYGAGRIREFAL